MSARGITSNEGLALVLGVSLATVKRTMRGDQPPSAVFLAALKLRLGLDFNLAAEAVEVDALREPVPA
jgi:transcriptional regulator with XRE-family HTH domain